MAQQVKLGTNGLILNWLKQVGDAVKAGDILAEVEADKATVEIEAPGAGVILEIHAPVGEERKEGDVIAIIGAAGEKVGAAAPAPSAPRATPAAVAAVTPGLGAGANVTNDGRVKASPLARKLADERGIDLNLVPGTGPGGRIVREDVLNFDISAITQTAPAAAPTQHSAAPAAALGMPSYGKLPAESDDLEIREISRMRRAIADNTVISKQQTPHFYVTVEIDVEPLLALRQQLNTSLEAEGVKITVNDMIVKATALALRKYPNLNSHYYGDRIVQHKRINIGIAVALPNNGLLNVVAKDADRVSLSVLAEMNKAMIARARDGKLKPDDLKGATFTVSNLGPYNVEHFLAIINPPEAGILAVGSALRVPVVLADGTLGIGNRMKVTISVDHRVSDGAEGAQYMQEFKALIENPMRLLV